MVHRATRRRPLYRIVGAFNIMFWNLFQTYGSYGRQAMSAVALAYIAIAVFMLMLIGLFLSAREFLRISDDPSQIVGVKSDQEKSY
tara:strand:- start:18 stop:275 length:258 start_codon:yes stop_codon:yes gene_type:complete